MGAIHVTALNNSEALADLIINNPDTDINLAGQDGVTALYMTAKREYDSDNVAKALLNKGAKLEFKNLSSPLIIAALEDAHKVTDLLLERGLRLNNDELKDLSDFYAVIGENNQSMKKVLEAHGLNLASHELYKEDKVNSSLQRLEKAGALTKAESHRWDSVLRIIESGNVNILKYYASSNALLDMKGEKALNAFHIAVESAQPQMISALVGLGLGEYINVKNTDDKTALMRAAEKGDLDSFKALLKAKADLKLTDKEGNTAIKLIEQPLTEIIKEKKLTEEDLKLLLDNGLNPNLEDKHGNNLVHLISKYGNETMLEIAFQAGADIHKRNNKKQTAFNTHSENIEHGQAIKNKLNFLALIEKDADGNNVLHHAAAVNNLAAIKELVNSGMSINEKNNNGETAFHIAAKHGQVKVLSLLKDLGADINVKDGNGWTPAYSAAIHLQDKALKTLKELGAYTDIDFKDGKQITHYAAKQGDNVALKILKELGMNINGTDDNLWTPAHFAAANGHSETLKVLKGLGASLDALNEFCARPIALAAKNGHSIVFKVLKELGEEIDYFRVGVIAAENGHSNILKTIAEFGELKMYDNHGGIPTSLAHHTAKHAHNDTLRVLKELGINLDHRDSNGLAVSHYAAQNGHSETLKVLKELGADIHARGGDSWNMDNLLRLIEEDTLIKKDTIYNSVKQTVLELGDTTHPQQRAGAIFSRMLWLSKASINSKEDLNYVHSLLNKDDGWTPAHFAAKNRHPETLKVLKELGADLNDKDHDGKTPAHLAAENQDIETLKVLKELGADLTIRDAKYKTPANYALENNDDKIRKALIDMGLIRTIEFSYITGNKVYDDLKTVEADLNFKDTYNHTALHQAALFGDANRIEELVKQGLNINERNKLGQTVFILAARNPTNGLEIIRKLKELGADIFARDNNGTNALHIALHEKNSALINELKKYGLSNKLFIPTNIKSK